MKSLRIERMNIFTQAKRDIQLRLFIGYDQILTIVCSINSIDSYLFQFNQRNMSNVVLTYFPMPARAEGIKLALDLAGIPFTFKSVQNWPEEKAEGLKSGLLPFGQVPLLQIDGMNIVQSMAILNYISRK